MTQRTDQQRKAIEVYNRKVADALCDAGFDLKKVLEAKPIAVSCTQENMKEIVFKAIMNALFPELKSTTQMDTKQVTQVYEHMNRWTGEQFGIHVPWPCEEELIHASRNKGNV